MRPRLLIGLFALLCVAQLGAVVSMVVRYEAALRSGTPYKIPVEPVDPADPFRGRYVAIRPVLVAPDPPGAENDSIHKKLEGWNQSVHVSLETGPDGFARVQQTFEEPPSGRDYLTATSDGRRYEPSSLGTSTPRWAGYGLHLPFDRYYMKETAAPQAEDAYRKAAGVGSGKRAWVLVRVRNGMGAVEGLYIDGVPIEDVVAARAIAR